MRASHRSKERSLRFESLEDRQLLSATPTNEQVTLLQTNMGMNIAQAITQGQQWTETDLPLLVSSTLHNENFTKLSDLSAQYATEKDTLSESITRQEYVRSDRAELGTHIAQDLVGIQGRQGTLADLRGTLATLQQQQTTLSGTITACTNSIASLTAEQATIPQRLPALQTEITSLTKQLQTLTAQRSTLQRQLTTYQSMLVTQQKTVNSLATQLALKPSNRTLQLKYASALSTLQNIKTTIGRLQTSITATQARQTTIGGTLAADRQLTADLQARLAAIPEEIARQTSERDQATASLAAVEEQIPPVTANVNDEQTALDAALADETRDQAIADADQEALDALAVTIANQEQELATMKAAVDQAIADLLANPPVLESPTLTETVSLSSGRAEGTGWTVDLPQTDGSASFLSWEGMSGAVPGVAPASAADLHRALVAGSLSLDQVRQSPSLAAQLGLANGYVGQPGPSYRYTTTGPFGTMTLITDNGDVDREHDPDAWPYYNFLGNNNGVLIASQYGGYDSYGRPVFSNGLRSGTGYVTASFAAPTYVQWIDVTKLGGQNNARLELTLADGSTRDVAVTGSGPVVVDDTLTSFRLVPRLHENTYGIRAINTDRPPVNVPDGTDALRGTGAVDAIDLRAAGKLVSSVSVRAVSDRPGDTVTAYAYSGQKLVATQVADPDDLVSFSDIEHGITSIVFTKADPSSSLFLSDLSITSWKDDVQPAAEAPTTRNNGTVALQHPQWENGTPYSLDAVARNNYVLLQYSAGDPLLVTPTAGARLYAPIDPSRYQRYEVRSAGGVGITEVAYLNESGLHKVPKEYWEQVSVNAIVVYPGAPGKLVLGIGGNGYFSFPAVTAAGDTITDVLPQSGVVIESSYLVVRSGGKAEGWQDIPNAVSSFNYHAGAGESVNVLFEVQNRGTGSGDITARAYVGQTGTAADRFVKEFTGSIDSLAGKALSVNAGLEQDFDCVTLIVTLPDGSTAPYSRKIHTEEADEMTDAEVKTEIDKKKIERLYQKIFTATTTSPTLESWRSSLDSGSAIASAHLMATIAMEELPPELTEAQKEEKYKIMMTANGVDPAIVDDAYRVATGLTDTIDPVTGLPDIDTSHLDPAQTMSTVLHWYNDPNPESPTVTIHNTAIRKDTYASRVFLGLYQQIWNGTDAEAKQKCAQVERALGIPWEAIWYRSQAFQRDFDNFFTRVAALFREQGFGDIFEIPQSTPQHPISVHTDTTSYRNGSIRIHWDQPLTINEKNIDHTRVYLVNAQTGDTLIEVSAGDIRNQLFLDVPVSSVGMSFTGPVEVKVVDWPVGATDDTEAIAGFSDPITVEWDGTIPGDYSTLPAGPEHDRENAILSQVVAHLPVDPNSGWYNLLGSPEHHAPYDVNAVDLNFGSVGADKDAPIYAVADGVVTRLYFTDNDPVNGVSILVLTHTLPDQTTWDSVYMHMPMRQRTDGSYDMLDSTGKVIVTLKEGETVTGHEQVAATGRQGTDGDHDHFEAHSGDWRSSPAMNLDGLFRTLETPIPTVVEVSGKGTYNVTFDSGVQQWVNQTDKVVAHIASIEEKDATGNVVRTYGQVQMLAWEAGKPVDQLQKVIWVHQLTDNRIVDAWLSLDQSKKWNSQTQQWDTL
jgi:hypothetical protein